MGDPANFARQLQRLDLLPGERIVAAWVAGVPYGECSNATKTGGTLALTDRRLIFQPLNVPLPVVPPNAAIRADEGWQAWIDESYFALELGELHGVQSDAERRSAAVIVGPGGSRTLNIGAGRFTPTFSKKNVAARDEAIAAIRAAIDRARSSGKTG